MNPNDLTRDQLNVSTAADDFVTGLEDATVGDTDRDSAIRHVRNAIESAFEAVDMPTKDQTEILETILADVKARHAGKTTSVA